MYSQRLIIIGTDGQSRIAAAIARLNGYDRISFLDSNLQGQTVASIPVIGSFSDFHQYPEAHFFIAHDNVDMLHKTYAELKKTDCRLISLIHPSAIVSDTATLGDGCLVLARSVIGARTSIGACSVISSCASIANDCQIGSFCQLATGVHINAKCQIGSNVLLGMRSIVIAGRTITSGTYVAPESIVIKNILS